jgi:hypothetical protein
VRVPPFVVVRRGGAFARATLPAGRLIVRGCAADEDAGSASQAGRSWSSGPVAPEAVEGALMRAFGDPRVAECVVQAFADGPSGVAFSVSHERTFMEYSAVHGGVTSGSVQPFSAVLPAAIPRYGRLSEGIARIHAEHGPCDIEFAGLEEPAFVQVRPITASFRCDEELLRVAMDLQELEGGAWELASYGIDLMERADHDAALRALFLERVGPVYEALAGGRPVLPTRPFLKVGQQTFLDRRVFAALRPGVRRSFALGLRQSRLLADIRQDLDAQPSPQRVMDASLQLNLLSEALGPVVPGLATRLLALRERCRALLAAALQRGEASPDVACSRRLAPRLVRDDVRLAWTELGWDGSSGLDVVPGDFASGPFVAYRRDPGAVPAGCVLVTAELYPELADVLGRVKAVVAEGGGFASHLAILARERAVPLRIRAVGALAELERTGSLAPARGLRP